MNLKKLFKLQAELDRRIEQEHPRKPGEDRLAKKNLALLVELGELANEARFFKFWSHDQKPRMEKEVFCTVCDGTGTPLGIPEESGVDCYQCDGAGSYFINPLLEEYVDGLHFILSIGLDILDDLEIYPEPIFCSDIVSQFNELFAQVSYFWNVIERDGDEEEIKTEYERIWSLLFGIAGLLGFTWEQIEESYFKKNRINHERQNNGY